MDEDIRKKKNNIAEIKNIREKKLNKCSFKWFGNEQELAELIIELYLKEYITLSGNPNEDASLFKKTFSNISKEKLISHLKSQKLKDNFDSLLYKQFSSDSYVARFSEVKKIVKDGKVRKSKVNKELLIDKKIRWIWSGINCANLIGTLTSQKWIISQSGINIDLAYKYIAMIIKDNFNVSGDIQKNLRGTFIGIPRKEN